MEENKIIIKKSGQDSAIFPIIVAIIMVLLFVFQVAVSRDLYKVNNAFINGEKAKRLEMLNKLKKERMEKSLMQERFLRQQEEEDLLQSADEQTQLNKSNKIAEVEQGMDYRQKLDIYRQAQK